MKDKRITISLTESQFEIWKQKAQEKEISLPEFIRRAVSVYITMLDRYNEKMQMGEAGRKKMRKEFDRKNVVSQYMKEIENIMA